MSTTVVKRRQKRIALAIMAVSRDSFVAELKKAISVWQFYLEIIPYDKSKIINVTSTFCGFRQ